MSTKDNWKELMDSVHAPEPVEEEFIGSKITLVPIRDGRVLAKIQAIVNNPSPSVEVDGKQVILDKDAYFALLLIQHSIRFEDGSKPGYADLVKLFVYRGVEMSQLANKALGLSGLGATEIEEKKGDTPSPSGES